MQIAKTVGIVIPTQMDFQGVYNLRIKKRRASRRQKAKLESTGAFFVLKIQTLEHGFQDKKNLKVRNRYNILRFFSPEMHALN